jgi:hypothetical protein
VTLVGIMLAAALPWLAATIWLLRRYGWELLWSRPDGRAFPSLADLYRRR